MVPRKVVVKVSSIIPPNCELASKEALAELKPGQIVYCVMSKKTSNEAGRKIFASVAAAFPKERGTTGYITEDSGYGSKEESKAKEMAVEMLAEDCEVFEAKEDATVEEYTTVVALAVFIP